MKLWLTLILKVYITPKTEAECKQKFDFEFEKIEMTKEVLQEFMWQEIQHFRAELKGKTWRLNNNTNIPAATTTANNNSTTTEASG